MKHFSFFTYTSSDLDNGLKCPLALTSPLLVAAFVERSLRAGLRGQDWDSQVCLSGQGLSYSRNQCGSQHAAIALQDNESSNYIHHLSRQSLEIDSK